RFLLFEKRWCDSSSAEQKFARVEIRHMIFLKLWPQSTRAQRNQNCCTPSSFPAQTFRSFLFSTIPKLPRPEFVSLDSRSGLSLSPPRPSSLRSPATQKCGSGDRSEEHTSELQSRGHLVCRLLLEKKKH